MRTLVLSTAVLIVAFTLAVRAEAAGPPAHHGDGHGPTVTLASHHGHHGGHHHPHYGPPHHSYRPGPPRYHHPHGYHPPVIVRPPVVVPYPVYPYYPYGCYRGYSYYNGGLSINTGRVGFSIAF